MRKALPVIIEDAELLKQRLQREYDGRKKPRLQTRYLLASGQAHTRQAVAQLLGVHRHTIGHWLALYEAGGLETLLALYGPAGKPLSLPPRCTGFASPGGQLSHALHHRPDQVQDQAQSTAASAHKQTLTPCKSFNRPVRSRYRVACRRSTPAPCGCAARRKAAWADSPCTADG
jgi:Homeodomain-like domain